MLVLLDAAGQAETFSMSKNPSRRPPISFKLIATCLLPVIVVLLVVDWHRTKGQHQPAEPGSNLTAQKAPTPGSPAATTRSSVSLPANWPAFQLQPFPVAYRSARYEWTLADGRTTNVIRRLAHNQLEYDRMLEENARIYERQLVYLNETAASVFEQAKATGQKVTQLTLPGLDGAELQFSIVKSQSNDGSSRQGMFYGHLAGDPNSLVTMAFQDGREAYTVLSPQENTFVVGEPREDGQVMVKAINPDTYGVGLATAATDVVPSPAQR